MEADLWLLLTRIQTWSEFFPACVDGTAGGVAFLMVLWVVSRWSERYSGQRHFQESEALNLVGVAIRLFVAPLFMIVAILLSIARAAGRSHYRW